MTDKARRERARRRGAGQTVPRRATAQGAAGPKPPGSGLLRMVRRNVTLPLAGLAIGVALTAACGTSTETIVNTTSPSSTRCQPTLGSPSTAYGPAGGTGTVTVAVERECEWAADVSASWIVVTAGRQGQGDGTVAYRVVENVDPVSRRGAIAVSGQSVAITQEPAPCLFSVSPGQLNVPSNGADVSVAVRTHSACSWTASAGASWTALSPTSGKGDGAVQVHVVANTGPARTGELTVAGRRIVVAQEARGQTPDPPTPVPNPPGPPPPPQCSYELSAGSASFTAAGGTAGFRVRTLPVCPWTVISSAAWVMITGMAAGSGEAEIRYQVAPNLSALARTATLTIQSEVFRITQARAEELRLEGKISSLSGTCPALRFRVDDRTVITDRNTDFRHGECSRVRNGEEVTVRGFVQPDGTVLATRVDL